MAIVNSERGGKCALPNAFSPIGRIESCKNKAFDCAGHLYIATPSDLNAIDERWLSWREYGRLGAGCSITSEKDARAKAIGEALESYAGSFVASHKITRYATAIELQRQKKPITPPDAYATFQPFLLSSHRNYSRFTEQDAVTWVEGKTISNFDPIWVPTQYGLYPCVSAPHEPNLVQCTSNGVATHRNYYSALLRAIAELIEREAILMHWWFHVPPIRIRTVTLTGLLQQVATAYAKMGLELRLYYFRSPIGWKTVMACIYQTSNDYLPWIAGHACSPCMQRAAIAAVEEMTKSFQLTDHSKAKEQAPRIKTSSHINGVSDHHYFYCNQDHWSALQWFLSSQETIDIDHSAEPFDSCTHTPQEIFDYHRPYIYREYPYASFVDFTPHDLRQLDHHVIKVILPGSIPVCFSAPFGYWLSERIQNFSGQLGRMNGEINQQPHPIA